jgi:hypothetical protein
VTKKKKIAARRKPLRRGKPSEKKKVVAKRGALTITEVDKLDDLRRELERAGASASPLRIQMMCNAPSRSLC